MHGFPFTSASCKWKVEVGKKYEEKDETAGWKVCRLEYRFPELYAIATLSGIMR